MLRHAIIAAGLLWIAACAQQPATTPAAPAPGGPAAQEDFETFCSHADCQHDVDIDLTQPDGSKYHRHFDLMPPSVQPRLVTIHPGQTVKATASFKDGKFAGWSEADPVAGGMAFTFELQQGTAGMMLSMHNAGGKPVKLALYKVDLQAAGDEPVYTDSCPVLAGGGGFETWPEPIFEIDVQSADIAPAAAAGTCN